MSNIAALASAAIHLDAVAGEPLDIEHGWGREVLGYVVVWCDAPVALSALPSADPKRVLRLLPSATCRLRLVLLT